MRICHKKGCTLGISQTSYTPDVKIYFLDNFEIQSFKSHMEVVENVTFIFGSIFSLFSHFINMQYLVTILILAGVLCQCSLKFAKLIESGEGCNENH